LDGLRFRVGRIVSRLLLLLSIGGGSGSLKSGLVLLTLGV
jgi:hypothetical protein